ARHSFSLQGGREEIDRYRERVRAKTALSETTSFDRRERAYRIKEGFKVTGQDGYQDKRERFKLGDSLSFTVNRSTLLSAAGMGGRLSRDFRLLKSALERLR